MSRAADKRASLVLMQKYKLNSEVLFQEIGVLKAYLD